MSYKTHFELNLKDIDLIESNLRSELTSLTREPKNASEMSRDLLKSRIDGIRTLLGKIHNQKIWYVGSGDVARIPRG